MCALDARHSTRTGDGATSSPRALTSVVSIADWRLERYLAAAVRPGDQHLGGGDRADTRLIEQRLRELGDPRLDLALELAFLGRERLRAAGERAQRDQRAARLRVAMPVRAHRPKVTE